MLLTATNFLASTRETITTTTAHLSTLVTPGIVHGLLYCAVIAISALFLKALLLDHEFDASAPAVGGTRYRISDAERTRINAARALGSTAEVTVFAPHPTRTH